LLALRAWGEEEEEEDGVYSGQTEQMAGQRIMATDGDGAGGLRSRPQGTSTHQRTMKDEW